ncbi:hypothetical protein C7974DRAFT_381089 [Boeremia exigua]|uniref:uncharacterized protein n=1 Tax=Boeremia exigua TaxID=749465 RepID=UPI001E8CFF2D|nr:uncharacterized protein C7974DRAFT_381089 [Boeremia exigua]KAH6612551.1 hypothetical protein C7974DRAFT_381089 [Boeremia exigua]
MRHDNGNHEYPSSYLAESRQPQMIIGNIVVQVVGSLVFFARVYSRAAIIKAWRAEDYILTLAWIFCTGYSVCQYGQIDHGNGRHAIATSIEHPMASVESQKYAYAAQIVLFPALALSKISICLTYLRIFYTDKRGRYMIRALLVILVLLTFPFMFEVAFQCSPVHVYWTEGRPEAKCLQDLPGFILSGSINVFVDVALMAIVLPRIFELQMDRRQKWALTGVVLLGSLAATAGIVRMVRVSESITMPNFDPSWDQYDVSIWTSTEVYTSLMCASAPGVKPILVKILPKWFGSSFSRSRTRTTGEPDVNLELGLSSRWKRVTIGSARTGNRRQSETVLVSAEGPYTEMGGSNHTRRTSKESEAMSTAATSEGERSHKGHIYKTSEVLIETQMI